MRRAGIGPHRVRTAPTNYRASLGSISPRIAGITVRIVDLGNKLQVTNHVVDLIVLGYNLEPYLRVDRRASTRSLRRPGIRITRARSLLTCPPRARHRCIHAAAMASRLRFSHRDLHDHRSTTWYAPPVAVQRDRTVHSIILAAVVLRYDARTVTSRAVLIGYPVRARGRGC